jgi:drug/metabolite transporter (DMT)-like permease
VAEVIEPTQKFKGATALFGAALTYASFGLLIRAMASMFGDNAQVAFRFVLAFVFLTLYGLLVKKLPTLPRNILWRAGALGVAFGGVVLLFTISVTNTKIANSVFLLYAGSIISSLLIGTVILKERLTGTKLLAIALGLVGLFMFSNALLALTLGVVTGLLSGLLDGVSNCIRKTLKGYDRNALLQYQFAFGSVFGLIMVAISGEVIIKDVSLLPIVAGVAFALLQISLGNLLLYGFQHFDVNVGTVILACELLFASLIGWLFFREVPTSNELLGGVIIFAASILSAVELPGFLKRRRAAIT